METAVTMALPERQQETGLMHHSDQGSLFPAAR
jgi:hypothetical protein